MAVSPRRNAASRRRLLKTHCKTSVSMSTAARLSPWRREGAPSAKPKTESLFARNRKTFEETNKPEKPKPEEPWASVFGLRVD
eukprot:15149899-Alexandrium_andersonii.AAC.1